MKSFRFFLLVLCLGVSIDGLAYGQSADEVQTLKAQLAERDRALNDLAGQLANVPSGLSEAQSAEIAAARTHAIRSFYEATASVNQSANDLRQQQVEIFRWQTTASNWLLFVVVVICLSGVLFAGYEMHSTRKIVTQAVPKAESSDGKDGQDALQGGAVFSATLEPKKIQFNSALIGITVMCLSLGFLYLFLQEVYRIRPIDLAGATKETTFVNKPQPESTPSE